MPLPVPGRIAEALRRSTVQIITGSGRRQGNGSGVALPSGQVITNAHVVAGSGLTVESWEGKSLTASVLKIDRNRDLALLSVPGLSSDAGSLADSDQLRVGTPVIAVGNPLGFTGALSSGIVHHIGPLFQMSSLTWIQADVRLAPGNSGGPLADFHGRVVGINTMIVSGALALAIPSRTVQAFLSRPVGGRSLGVVVRPVQLRNQFVGLMILELVKGGAAEGASLLPGDILVAADGVPFRTLEHLQRAIDESRDGLLHIDFHRGDHRGHHGAATSTTRHVSVRLSLERVQSAA
ncbi:MAG: trypsin-like peptidase domain-containing protein [Acidobacteriaceae bacterium]|nr:trypsin-like peptidase domain-containing protein [Acidobacteriaceae bacterium]